MNITMESFKSAVNSEAAMAGATLTFGLLLTAFGTSRLVTIVRAAKEAIPTSF